MIDPDRTCMRCMTPLKNPGAFCPRCGAKLAELKNQSNQLPIGYILGGKFLMGAVLGQGGFGITYVAWDCYLERKVAVKEFFPEGLVSRDVGTRSSVFPLSGDKQAAFASGKERFVQEGRVLARFSGEPCIVNVREFLYANGTAYLVMDFAEGETLLHLLKRRERLPSGEALQLLYPVMDVLSQVHGAGLLHRDISPDNMILRPDGSVVLIDFGAARQISVMGEHSNTINVKHGYAPAEQYQTHGEQGPWTDVYALCATLYKLTTGVTPTQAMDRVLEEAPLTPPNQLGADFSPTGQEALMKGLSLRGRDRQQSMEECKRDFLAGDAPGPHPPVPEPRPPMPEPRPVLIDLPPMGETPAPRPVSESPAGDWRGGPPVSVAPAPAPVGGGTPPLEFPTPNLVPPIPFPESGETPPVSGGQAESGRSFYYMNPQTAPMKYRKQCLWLWIPLGILVSLLALLMNLVVYDIPQFTIAAGVAVALGIAGWVLLKKRGQGGIMFHPLFVLASLWSMTPTVVDIFQWAVIFEILWLVLMGILFLLNLLYDLRRFWVFADGDTLEKAFAKGADGKPRLRKWARLYLLSYGLLLSAGLALLIGYTGCELLSEAVMGAISIGELLWKTLIAPVLLFVGGMLLKKAAVKRMISETA